jgi:hypothetical protein
MADTQSIIDIPTVPTVQQMVSMRPPFKKEGQNWMVKAHHGNKMAKSKVGPVVMDLVAVDTEQEADEWIRNLKKAGWEHYDLFKTRMNVWGPIIPPKEIVTEEYFQPHLDKIMKKEHAARNAEIEAFQRRMDEKFQPTPESIKMEEDIRESSSAPKRPKREVSMNVARGYTIGKAQTTRPTTGQIIGDVTMS